MASLDDAFSDFLKEVGEDGPPDGQGREADQGGDGAASPSCKKARTAGKESMSRAEQAEALRKASYLGKLADVEGALAALPVAERLLLIDELDPDDGFAAIHLAVIRGHLDVVKVLVRRRADVDLPTRDGDTPLMWAAHQGKMAACKGLLRIGADAAVRNRMKTAAMQAKAAGHRRICELLENHAFDVAAGLKRSAASKERAAEARRAANAAMVAEAVREAKEKEEEEAYWAGVRARRERREASGEDDDKAAREAYSAARAEASRAEAVRAAEQAAALAGLPSKMQPHYGTLEIPADASEAEVRKAYRRLALKFHPDKNPKDPTAAKEVFTKVAVAYEAVCEYLAGLDSAAGGVRVAPPSSY